MSNFGWPRRGFLNLVGLDHNASGDGRVHSVELAEAAVDSRTGGAVAVTTEAELDGKDGVSRIKTYYWRMLPNGEQLSEKLFNIEFEPGETMVPRAVWVLGRKLYEASDEDDWDLEDGEQSTAQGMMSNLSRVMGAVGEVNRQMREGKLPEVAKILKDYAVHDAVGEKLVITGQSSEGGFNFDMVDARRAENNVTLTVPTTVARALTGFGVNTLDEHQRLSPEIHTQASDPRTGAVFKYEAHTNDSKNPMVSTAIAPTSSYESTFLYTIPHLINVEWEADETGNQCTLKETNLLGEPLTGENHLKRIQSIGVANCDLHALRKRRYPTTMNHLIEYDLHDLVTQFEPPPPLAEGGRLSMISVGGNNMEEIADGFGEAIGGNSKVVYHEGLGKNGKIDRVGVIIDLGLHLSPKDEVNVSAAPDVIEHLKYCTDILITHRHLDHTDGLFAYIQYGYLKGKTVHATPEVIRALRDKLATYPSIHKDDLPTFSPLIGEGWLHVKDNHGDTRLSVNYSRNATPHSARTTPFCVHGHYKGKWLGSYLNHGDARYGRHNADDYKGPAVDADHLDQKFFTETNKRLLREVTGLEPSIVNRRATYFDMDITSILKKGWAPTEHEFEDNLVEISDWFQDKDRGFTDKGILLAMISTSDNKYEAALRAATRGHRDVTEFGTNLVKTATTMNVLGVNDLRHEPLERNNIQPYLDQYFEQRLKEKIEKQKITLVTASEPKKSKLECKLERNEARLAAFRILTAMPNQFSRYKKRAELEAALEARFGRSATLGSLTDEELVEYENADDDHDKLGAVRVGRTSKTARAIMGLQQGNLVPEGNGRRLALLTGTQNTNAEVDAALVGLSEGRNPTLDGNPKNNHLARPVAPCDNVIVIAQTAIPGNNGKQDLMVRKLMARDFMVVQAAHDGFIVHNIDSKKRLNYITGRLDKLGKSYKIEEDGSLVVTGMPIHAGGHGYEKDCEAWVKLVQADVTAAQHTSDPQGGKRHSELCRAANCRYMDRVVPNFEGLDIRANDSAANAKIHSIGKTMASLIRILTERQQREYHSGHITAQRIVRTEAAGGFRSDGLLATAQAGGVYKTAFATVDAENAARALAQRRGSRPEPVPENRMTPRAERLDRGPELPGREFRHRLFDSQSKPQTSGFVRRTS